MNKERETDRVFDDFRDALSSEQLTEALRSIKRHLEKVKVITPSTEQGENTVQPPSEVEPKKAGD